MAPGAEHHRGRGEVGERVVPAAHHVGGELGPRASSELDAGIARPWGTAADEVLRSAKVSSMVPGRALGPDQLAPGQLAATPHRPGPTVVVVAEPTSTGSPVDAGGRAVRRRWRAAVGRRARRPGHGAERPRRHQRAAPRRRTTDRRHRSGAACSGAEVLGAHGVEELAELPHQLVGSGRVAVLVLVLGGQEDPFGVHELVGHEQRAARCAPPGPRRPTAGSTR